MIRLKALWNKVFGKIFRQKIRLQVGNFQKNFANSEKKKPIQRRTAAVRGAVGAPRATAANTQPRSGRGGLRSLPSLRGGEAEPQLTAAVRPRSEQEETERCQLGARCCKLYATKSISV